MPAAARSVRGRSTGLVLALVAAGALSVGAAGAGAASPPVKTAAAPAGAKAVAAAPAGKPLGDAAIAVARNHLRAYAADAGLAEADVDDLGVSSVVPTDHNGLTNVYFQQRVDGIDVVGAVVNVAVRSDGTVFRTASSAVADAAKTAGPATPAISDVQAASRAAAALGLHPTGSFASAEQPSGVAQQRELGAAGISLEPIPVRLVYAPDAKGHPHLAWELVIYQLDTQHWWQIRIDARTGDEISRNDWVAADSYSVYPVPTEAPTFSVPVKTPTVVSGPATSASPFGWNDTNGVAGAESTLTTGNNVHAYTDTDANNAPDPGSEADGGANLNFLATADLNQAPSTYKPAAVTNLYFTNNRIHDIMYRFGFTESAGNFQVNNYGHGGTGSDAVNAEAQDGAGINNANFGTPPDGSAPRMQMFLWNTAAPALDGDFDNGVIVHEYAHGISNRLTGGPANTGCLGNDEQAGEGWSDFYAYMLTMPGGTEPAGGRGIGTYVLNQATSGVGIREHRYSTNLAINPETYDKIKTAVIPHGVGAVWAEMLWEMTYALIDAHGFSADLVNGPATAGNILALQLVTDGLKLQPCSPGFVDARDAILAADRADTGGQNQCLIWKAFAKRGLGFSATQGSSGDRSDGTQAFDISPTCLGVTVTRTATPDPAQSGHWLTYGFHVANTLDPAGPVSGVSVSGTVGANATYVPGSATCGGSYDAGTKTVTFAIGTMAAGASTDCQFKVLIDPAAFPVVSWSDDFEPDASGWAASHASGTTDWAISTSDAHSPTHSVFGDDPGILSDKYLTMTTAVPVTAGQQLSFWHKFDLESGSGTGYDGGVVEVSTDGGATWNDIGDANWLQNGYNFLMSTGYSSPIGGRKAFSGTAGWRESIADLSPWVGQSIRVRFRLASDTDTGATGWTVDDVAIGTNPRTTSVGTAKATGAPDQASSLTTRIVQGAATPDAPTVTGTAPGSGSAQVGFSPGAAGSSPVTGFTAECVSTNGGATGSAAGPASPLTVTGLSGGKSYHCRVKATNGSGDSSFSAFGPTVTLPAPPATAPGAPVVTKAVPVSPKKAKVTFTLASNGGSAVTSYAVTCTSSNGGKTKTRTGPASPITVKGLTPGKKYTCTVKATNAVGTGPASAPSKRFKMPKARR